MEKYRITINNRSYEVEVEVLESDYQEKEPKKFLAPPTRERKVQTRPLEGKKITSPLPGTVIEIKVAPGDEVTYGQVVLVLEAMKMENEVRATQAGRVAAVHVTKGKNVQMNDLLVSLE